MAAEKIERAQWFPVELKLELELKLGPLMSVTFIEIHCIHWITSSIVIPIAERSSECDVVRWHFVKILMCFSAGTCNNQKIELRLNHNWSKNRDSIDLSAWWEMWRNRARVAKGSLYIIQKVICLLIWHSPQKVNSFMGKKNAVTNIQWLQISWI